MPTNEVQNYKKIGPKYRGILFDGTNGREVVAYLEEKGKTARAGGNWVRIEKPVEGLTHTVVSRGTWVLVEEFSDRVVTVADDVFEDDFKIAGRRSKDTAYIRKAANVEAIQLDGNNAKAVAEFARSKGRVARGGNGWVKFSDRTAKVSDFVVWYPEAEGLGVMEIEVFEHTFAATR